MAVNETQELRIKKQHKQLRVLICDDDRNSLERTYRKAREVFEKLGSDVAFNLFDRCTQITVEHMQNCDIVLLDVDLEGQEQNGIDVARRIRAVNNHGLILFITSFIEYAPEGYEVQAFRYILKRDLDAVLGRYLMQALEQLSENCEVLQLQSRGELVNLPVDSILYLEVLGHSVSVVTAEQVYTVNASLSSFEQQLENHGFLRVHKSYLVNMRHIRKFQCRELALDNGSTLRVSEKSYAEQKRKYLLWKGWQ